jgi:hypothetical protein
MPLKRGKSRVVMTGAQAAACSQVKPMRAPLAIIKFVMLCHLVFGE